MTSNGTDSEKLNGSDNGKSIGTNKQLHIPDIIIKKRDGHALNQDEIEFFVEGVVNNSIQQAQLGAMLMAIFVNHLNNEETTHLTRAMTHSGDVLHWPEEWRGKIVDKHSTGGVGDKVSLVLAPALAACGMKVPMVSGRGLGHTGGTLDKLEAIPGFRVSLSDLEMKKVLDEVGCCIVGQTSNLVPADKIMYATRDVTGTTDSIGLIASSIISKKAAEDLDALVLDVKVGRGAFLKDETMARELARRMVDAGNGSGVNTAALLTSMDSPIGHMVGNALEVVESIYCLHGEGPDDLMDLTVKLGGHLLYRAGKASGVKEGCHLISDTLHDGSAITKFCAMMKAQGVKPNLAEQLSTKGVDVTKLLPKAKYITELKSPYTGFVHDIDAMKCAIVSGKLGAGRTKSGDPVNFAVGLELNTDVGNKIDKDALWVRIHHDDSVVPEDLLSMLKDAIIIKPETVKSAHKGTRVIDAIT